MVPDPGRLDAVSAAPYLTQGRRGGARLSVGKWFIFSKLTLSNSYAAQGQICIAIVIFQSVIAEECEILMRLFPGYLPTSPLPPLVSPLPPSVRSHSLFLYFFFIPLPSSSSSSSIQNLKQISPLHNRIHYCLSAVAFAGPPYKKIKKLKKEAHRSVFTLHRARALGTHSLRLGTGRRKVLLGRS